MIRTPAISATLGCSLIACLKASDEKRKRNDQAGRHCLPQSSSDLGDPWEMDCSLMISASKLRSEGGYTCDAMRRDAVL